MKSSTVKKKPQTEPNLIAKSTDRTDEKKVERSTNRTNERKIERSTNERKPEKTSERTNARSAERATERTTERSTERSTERTNERKNERTAERSNERSNERSTTSERKTEKTTERSNEECKFKETLSFLLDHKKANQPMSTNDSKDKIDYLRSHVKKDRQRCTKCSVESVYMMIGCFYFESFKRRLAKFKGYVIDKEIKSIDQNKDKPKDKNWDDIKMKNCDTYSDLINLDSQGKILEYLIEVIDLWNKVLGVKERLKPELINDLEVYEILKNCYFIFNFYGAVKYVKLTCHIYLELVVLHGQALKNHLLLAYYCQIRFCLDYGLLDKVKNYLRSCKSWINGIPKANLKKLSFELKLIKVVECESKLILNEDIEQTANDLNELLEDEFFGTVTVITGYIKCLVYYLASKFSAKLYPNQDLYHFFNECFSFTKAIITKWYPLLNDSPNPEDQKSIKLSSPLWLEFAVSKFTLEFSLTYYNYSVNSSIGDYHFYFNILVTRLARIYCTLLWLSRILILSSYHEKIEVQKMKINQVKNLFKKKKCDLNRVNNQQQIANKLNNKKVLSNQTNNIPMNQTENETVNIQDDSLDMRTKEYSNCLHQEDTPIYLLKKSMLKNPIVNEEIEFVSNFNYEKELENLDSYLIPDLIIVKQELLLFLYLINESKESFVNYFQELDLDIVNTIYFESLTDALNVEFDLLNRNHQNLITSSFNMRCLLIYLQQIQLNNSSILDLTRNVLKKATKLGHSYEIHCFITDLILYYVNSSFKEIYDGKLNILEYDFIECEKYLLKPLITDSPPVKQRPNLRSRVKPKAPKKVRNYKMDEIKDYIQEMYDLNCQKNSVKLNFTSSDEEEANEGNDKENLKLKINKLKSIRQEVLENDKHNKFEIKSKKAVKNDATYLKDKRARILSNEPKELNSLNDRIGNLNLDDDLLDLDKLDFEYLINESSSDYLFEFKKLLNKALDLFGKNPPVKHYNEINTILFKLSICKGSTFSNESAFYFSELCHANALRYKTLTHLQKKQKYVPTKYESKVLEFKSYNQIESKSEELSRMFDILPSKWRIVQVQFIKGTNSQTDLYITRYSRNKNPIMLKINVNSEKLCTSFTNEFEEIIKLSNDTVKEKDSNSFWKLRFALDERLKKLLTDVNSAWISCFIGIFLGECRDPKFESIFNKIEEKIIEYAKKNGLRCLNEDLLKVICESFVYLKEEPFNHSMVTLFEPKNRFDDLYDQCLMIVKKYIKFNTQEELKEKIQGKIRYAPVGLITGNTLENFPFESLLSLRMLNLEIFRIPSVRFLNWMYLNLRRTNQRLQLGVSDKDVYYLINPSNNLEYTEEFFKDKFEGLKNKTNWEGLIGEIPSQLELQKALENKDAYIYFGHNSGVRYLGKLHTCNVNCIALVMGCSSAALSNQDNMVESFGSSYHFLINGCPTYLGCLWNVTDRDIDRFAERFLKHTFKIYDQEEEEEAQDQNNNIQKCSSIAKALALSRNICKLKYLNGSAPVLHGLPISMKRD